MDSFIPRNFIRGLFGLFVFYPLQMIRRASSSLFTTISNVVFRGIFTSKPQPAIDFPKASKTTNTKVPVEGQTSIITIEGPQSQDQDVSNTSHELHPTKRPSIESLDVEGPPSKIKKTNKVELKAKDNDKGPVPLSKQIQKTLDRNKNKAKQKHDKHLNVPEAPKPERLNYFVAFQVNNPEILKAVEEVQKNILEGKAMIKNRKGVSEELPGSVFKDSMIKVQKLHFTLHVVNLKDDEDKAKATTVMEKVWMKYRPHFKETPMTVKIDGMGNFRNTVLFANLQGEDHINRLTELAETLREEFEAVDIYGETRPFKPHMTIAKLSRSKTLYRKNVKSFPKETWNESCNFGLQKVESLQLLSMQDKPDPQTGYYKCLAEFKFE